MGNKYVKSKGNRKFLYIDATSLYGWALSEFLPHDEIKMRHGHPDCYIDELEGILNTPDDSNIGYFVEMDLLFFRSYRTQKQRISHLLLKIKFFLQINLVNKWMISNQMSLQKLKKVFCGWTDKKSYLIQYRNIKNYVKHEMVVDKIMR